MSLSNLYAPVETPDAGLALDVSPLTNALNAIYQRRAQMQMHRDSLEAQRLQNEKANALGWAQLRETNQYHGAEVANYGKQRELEQAKIDATKAEHTALQEEKDKVQQAAATGEAQQFAQTPAAADPSAIAALRAHVQSQGMRPYTQAEQFSPGGGPRPTASEDTHGFVPPWGGQMGPVEEGPVAVPSETGMEAPQSGARVNLDPQVAVMRLAAQARARQAQFDTATSGVADPMLRKARQGLSAAVGLPATSGVPQGDPDKLSHEEAVMMHGQENATRMAAASRVSTGSTAEDRQVNQLTQRMKSTVDRADLPSLEKRIGELGEVKAGLGSNSGGYMDEMMVRKIGMMFNKGPFGDKDAVAADPTNKAGIPSAIFAAMSGAATGIKMTPEVRSYVEHTVDQWQHDIDNRARNFYNKQWRQYATNPRNSRMLDIYREQSQANFGNFPFGVDQPWNHDEPTATKPKVKPPAEPKTVSTSVSAGGHAAAGPDHASDDEILKWQH